MKIASLPQVSLDAPLGNEDSDTHIGDMVEDTKTPTTVEEVTILDNKQVVRKLFQSLSDQEISVIKDRFGFDGREIKTFDEIGDRYGRTRERIRQIQEKAFRKLRNAHRRMIIMGKP
jgi:RNA polymerase primary sigma factor